MLIDIGYPGPGSHAHERSRMGAEGQVAGSRSAEQDGRGERGPRDGEDDEAVMARPRKQLKRFNYVK